MAAFVGKAEIHGIQTTAFSGTQATITKYGAAVVTYSPRIDSAAFTLNGQASMELDQNGEVGAMRFHGETLEVDFMLTPWADTEAHAKLGVAIPVAGSVLLTSNFPTIAIGNFTDAFNATDATTGWPFIIQPGVSFDFVKDGVLTIKLRAIRSKSLPNGTAITG